MRILSFVAENFKKIRVVEIVPKGRVTTITGRNGQGKTSVLDALWALFAGKKGIPEKPVRKGADKSKLRAVLSDDDGKPYLIANRTIAGDRTTTLTIEAAAGAQRPAGTPQAVMDALIGEMTFDPVAFSKLDAKKQSEILRATVKIDVDLDDLGNANRLDYAERTLVNNKLKELRTQVATMVVSPGLPKERVNEEEIKARKAKANEANKLIVGRIQEKVRLESALRDAEASEQRNKQFLIDSRSKLEQIEKEATEATWGESWRKTVAAAIYPLIKTAIAYGNTAFPKPLDELYRRVAQVEHECAKLDETYPQTVASFARMLEEQKKHIQAGEAAETNLQTAIAEARVAWEQVPEGAMVDATALDEELERAQLTNREIGKRERRDEIEAQLQEREKEAARLTRLMESREEKKVQALAAAKMPVEGLTFDEDGVWMKGIPLGTLGHAEKIRVGCAIAIACVEEGQRKDKTGKLRCIPVDDAESMDDESLEILSLMAEEHDFQLILFKVDTSGKCGIVLEDGMVQAVND